MTRRQKQKQKLQAIPPDETCNGRNKAHTSYCKHVAGWGTDHVGTGRCKLHGGSGGRPIKHGRYSKAAKGKLRDKYEEQKIFGNPLDLLDELELQRALVARELEKNEKDQDIKILGMLTRDVVSTVEKVIRLRLAEELTLAEINYARARMIDICEKYIPDPNQRRAFVQELIQEIPGEYALLPAEVGQ